ncbi:MAG: hypothetical protein HY293_16695, partial [Planctomycetes bacterium]|nr:hypothetical protein [Planctomycetota bacterium]
MSPRAKRWILHFLRIAVTAVAVIVVVRMIRWQDYWLVDGKSYDLDKIKRVYHFSGPGQNVVWADGHESFHSSAARREGFLSLFDHTNKPLFFAMMAALLVPFFLLSLRWWLLLRGHGFRPRLGQVFFIGDGLTGTGTGVPQVFYVPKGAVRLFLVDIDGYEWADNGGSYSVEIMAAGKVPAAP